MKICFVCCRPFQLLNAINYIEMSQKKTSLDEIDIFLSSRYKDKYELKKVSQINHVYYFNETTGGGVLKKIGRYVFLNRSIKSSLEILNINIFNVYSEIYGTSFNDFFVRLCNANSKAKVVLLEDGIGTYMNDGYINHLNSYVSNLLKIFKRGVLSIDINKLYCYHPELMCLSKDYPIFNLPLLTTSTLQIVAKVFGYSCSTFYKKKRIIYFTSDDTWEKFFNIRESTFIDAIYEYKESMLIRFHPNLQEKNYKDVDADESYQLWELRCNEVQQNNILIGIFSTAQFSPYMLYGKQYFVILLYKMVFPIESYMYKQCEKTVDILKKDFPNIYTPHTINDYVDIVSRLLDNET